jgi:hypothetical protein
MNALTIYMSTSCLQVLIISSEYSSLENTLTAKHVNRQIKLAVVSGERYRRRRGRTRSGWRGSSRRRGRGIAEVGHGGKQRRRPWRRRRSLGLVSVMGAAGRRWIARADADRQQRLLRRTIVNQLHRSLIGGR